MSKPENHLPVVEQRRRSGLYCAAQQADKEDEQSGVHATEELIEKR